MKLDLPQFAQQRVLVLGLGDSGLAMARWCARFGAQVTVWDSREQPPQLAALGALGDAAASITGELTAEIAAGFNAVLKSPGLSPLDARLAAVYAHGPAVRGELDLFADALAAAKAQHGYSPAVLAISGTNGKTTTTCMTGLLVECAGKRVAIAGNIGPTLLDTLTEALDKEPDPAPVATPVEVTAAEVDDAPVEEEGADEAAVLPDEDAPLPIDPPPPRGPVFETLPEVWVLELSSFQLDGVVSFEPTAGAVLNLTQDHLDWHGDMAGYGRAKARVFGRESVLVVNRDDAEVEALVPAPVLVKGSRGKPGRTVSRRVVRFGLNPPRSAGDFGLVDEGGLTWLVRALELDPTIKRKKGEEAEPLIIQRLMPADALRVRGRHNAANALAALALATTAGCELAPMLHGLREYRGEPHRVEPVGSIDGVEFFDDSKGTNVGATVAAISGLGADRTPAKLVLILGGDGKGQDFAPLAAGVERHVRAVALIGRDAAQIEAALANTGVPMQHHATLEAATAWCLQQAQPGDSVLLSPACASLDMFRNYAHRAEVFVATVQQLADERGVAL
ncbi:MULTISPECIES: UDP-N-acetylmuramoyl-L-alanine--D-glutamate ligase [unclassified Roseateles]|uniref:UDP-N-acetylmuramoyl-L-alanine--D-glutamate ligase n=1 Tax=unclassified Roseateles TaxID=2626991 RepID=UPI0006F863BE|nr:MULTISPECIES: UDP-N-acetylmuramoyl-L-alanine--D-glutamate ligase [unclassified Roseateles]KQW51575.1 UDP-N-acetylmuramoylalanine--D-glutamate ligase [Pelomonas sp. Root405]KRA77808.1 UDP-N-acetylmuramoylalanine--D-glutamate ligase [Pelomonas sp. Root662]